jgi:hypothetical protein
MTSYIFNNNLVTGSLPTIPSDMVKIISHSINSPSKFILIPLLLANDDYKPNGFLASAVLALTFGLAL